MEKIKKIVIASSNKNKVREISEKLKSNGIDLELVMPDFDFNPEETGANFRENALIKAKEAAKTMNLPALGDDTGLCVDALDGAPGLYSSRFACGDDNRIQKLLEYMKDIKKPNRTAYFTCSLSLVDPKGELLCECEGKITGEIIEDRKGLNGFGYDPIFYIPELKKTMAELSLEEKNNYSHRSVALNKLINWLKK